MTKKEFSRTNLSRVLLLAIGAALPMAAQTAKPRINTEADIPRLSYPVRGSVQDLVQAPDAEFLVFAEPVQRDVKDLLARYEVTDHGALRQLLNAKLNLELIEGRNQEALETVRELRANEDKPGEKLTTGLEEETFARTRSATAISRRETCPAGYGAAYQAALATLPWSQVASAIRHARGTEQIATSQFFVGITEDRIGPTVAKLHAVDLPQALYVIRARAALLVLVGCKTPSLAALDAYVAQHSIAKPDIWSAREIVFLPAASLTPVNVAIWDSGIDTTLFPGRLYTDPTPVSKEDTHGIAYDLHALPTHGELMPLTPSQTAAYPEAVHYSEGIGDFQLGVDTPAAAEFRIYLGKMTPDQVRAFFDADDAIGSYMHGTHVAGIAARGNSAIRLAYVRTTFDTNNPHLPPTEQDQSNVAASYASAVAWFKTHGIRVVNMSWWDRPSNFEKDLSDNGIGKSPAERKAIARRYFEIERDGLYNALKSAPDILFVTVAGNNDANNTFEECIPSSFDLPNLIVTGAVDQAGDETGFTSYGSNVIVHANGFAVPSLVPGGATVRMSGTSMAAPQVTNLAAKLLAVDPHLTPAQVVALIRNGATTTEDGRRHLLNPARSMEILGAQGQQKAGMTRPFSGAGRRYRRTAG